MSNFECGTYNPSVSIALIASSIIGVIAAFLNVMAIVAVTATFAWVTFGIATLFISILLGGTTLSQNNRHYGHRSLNAVLLSALGTILLSVILLAIPFTVGSISSAIITGIALFFFSALLTTTVCLIKGRE